MRSREKGLQAGCRYCVTTWGRRSLNSCAQIHYEVAAALLMEMIFPLRLVPLYSTPTLGYFSFAFCSDAKFMYTNFQTFRFKARGTWYNEQLMYLGCTKKFWTLGTKLCRRERDNMEEIIFFWVVCGTKDIFVK
jgi:hypothetical protein